MNNERRIDTGDPNRRRLSLRAAVRLARTGLERLRGDATLSDEATVTQLPQTPEQISRSHHPAFRGDSDRPRLSSKEMIAKLEAEGKIRPELHSVDEPDGKD